MSKQKKNQWRVVAVDPPKLSQNQWNLAALAGLILLVAAVLQIISFQDFINNLGATGMSHVKWWAGIILFGEVIAIASFFKVRLSPAFRIFSGGLALLVSFFWLFETFRQVSGHADSGQVADFFGKYLPQQLGWWAAIEATLFCALVLYLLGLQKWPKKIR